MQVPANRIGHTDAKISAATLRAIAEVHLFLSDPLPLLVRLSKFVNLPCTLSQLAIIVSFIFFQNFVLHEPVKLNHLIGFAMVLAGVCVVVGGPWHTIVLGRVPDAPADTPMLMLDASDNLSRANHGLEATDGGYSGGSRRHIAARDGDKDDDQHGLLGAAQDPELPLAVAVAFEDSGVQRGAPEGAGEDAVAVVVAA